MRTGHVFLLALLMSCSHLFGQSKSETIAFITREIRSCDSDQLEVKDVEFTDGGNTCKIRVAMPNQSGEKAIELSLRDVDVYSVTKILKIGNDEQVYVYSLVASPRGRSGAVRRNMTTIMGPEVILQNILCAQKIKALELAFAHLTELTTGQLKRFLIIGQSQPERAL